jgi:hypothetical protein
MVSERIVYAPNETGKRIHDFFVRQALNRLTAIRISLSTEDTASADF